MNLKSIYEKSPKKIKKPMKISYNNYNKLKQKLLFGNTDEQLRKIFVQDFFQENNFEKYRKEYEESDIKNIKKEALDEFNNKTGKEELGDIGINGSLLYYSIIREEKPEIVVETGVANGLSSLSILKALEKNGMGELYSVDYPLRYNEATKEQKQNFAVIPSDKNSGWMVPDYLTKNWTLIEDKSQSALPKLYNNIDSIDVFIHDSDHSFSCMSFEYELAYNWLKNNGILISDDIDHNNAFRKFIEEKDVTNSYKIKNSLGLITN